MKLALKDFLKSIIAFYIIVFGGAALVIKFGNIAFIALMVLAVIYIIKHWED